MIVQIINTTDGKYVGVKFNDQEPILLDGKVFTPDKLPTLIGEATWRLYNSNFSIDVQEV